MNELDYLESIRDYLSRLYDFITLDFSALLFGLLFIVSGCLVIHAFLKG